MFATKKFLEESQGLSGNRFRPLEVALKAVGTRQALQTEGDALILHGWAFEFSRILGSAGKQLGSFGIAPFLQSLLSRVVLGFPAIFIGSRPA